MRGETQLRTAKTRLAARRGGLELTSHPIVGEPLTELIDHDEEDAQRVTKATLTKRNNSPACSSPVHTHTATPEAGQRPTARGISSGLRSYPES